MNSQIQNLELRIWLAECKLLTESHFLKKACTRSSQQAWGNIELIYYFRNPWGEEGCWCAEEFPLSSCFLKKIWITIQIIWSASAKMILWHKILLLCPVTLNSNKTKNSWIAYMFMKILCQKTHIVQAYAWNVAEYVRRFVAPLK